MKKFIQPARLRESSGTARRQSRAGSGEEREGERDDRDHGETGRSTLMSLTFKDGSGKKPSITPSPACPVFRAAGFAALTAALARSQDRPLTVPPLPPSPHDALPARSGRVPPHDRADPQPGAGSGQRAVRRDVAAVCPAQQAPWPGPGANLLASLRASRPSRSSTISARCGRISAALPRRLSISAR